MKLRIISITVVAALLAAIAPACAAEDDAARKAELKTRFIARHEKLIDLKQKGLVGETAEGTVEIIDPAALEEKTLEETRAFLGEENKDRQELYAIVARETGTTLETVIKQSVSREFKLASLEEYFRARDGKWRQKKEMLQGSDKAK